MNAHSLEELNSTHEREELNLWIRESDGRLFTMKSDQQFDDILWMKPYGLHATAADSYAVYKKDLMKYFRPQRFRENDQYFRGKIINDADRMDRKADHLYMQLVKHNYLTPGRYTTHDLFRWKDDVDAGKIQPTEEERNQRFKRSIRPHEKD